MEEILALVFLVTIFLGYIALCAGVGYFAYKNDQSFLLFFALAVIFSPVPIFVVVLILSVATGSLGASDEIKEGAPAARDAQHGGSGAASGATNTDHESDGREAETDQRETASSPDHAAVEAEEDWNGGGGLESDTPDVEGGDVDVDEPFPWEEEDAVEGARDDDEGLDGEPEAPEGKVRCDVCHSFVDENEPRCPACGNRLE